MKPKLQVASCRFAVPQVDVPARFSSTFNFQPFNLNLRRAFTLIEMLAVIFILGVLAALLVPALKNIGHAGCHDRRHAPDAG